MKIKKAIKILGEQLNADVAEMKALNDSLPMINKRKGQLGGSIADNRRVLSVLKKLEGKA